MVLTPEQTKELKEQLKEQVKDLPPGKKEQALVQIEAMSPDALETMLMNQQQGQGGTQKGIFRMIVDGDVPSKKVADNDDAIAVVSKRIKGKMYIPTDILFSYLSLLVLDFATWKIFTQRVLTVEIFSHISSMMSSV